MDILDNKTYASALRTSALTGKPINTRRSLLDSLNAKNKSVNVLVEKRTVLLEKKKLHQAIGGYNVSLNGKISGLTIKINRIKESCEFEENLLRSM